MSKKEVTDTATSAMIDKLHSRILLRALNELIEECMDEFMDPKAPSRRAIMEARKLLPKQYSNTLMK